MKTTPQQAPAAPSAEIIAEMLTQWIDPVTEEPPGTKYGLYSTLVRGANTQSSYLVYLPAGYEKNPSLRFPVIYWLHGGFGNARQGAWAVQFYDSAMQDKLMPEAIIVLVQALPVGWYVDSKDGKLPIEQVIIKDLIPHIDNTYRTIAQKEGRGIEGHSMGGYGALRLGLKYPHLFGAVSAVAPSILRNLGDEPIYRTYYTFDGDQDYYEEVGPWNLSRLNAQALRENNTCLRILSGELDDHLQPILHGFHSWLGNLNIRHTFLVAKGAGHGYQEILEGCGEETFTFWARALTFP